MRIRVDVFALAVISGCGTSETPTDDDSTGDSTGSSTTGITGSLESSGGTKTTGDPAITDVPTTAGGGTTDISTAGGESSSGGTSADVTTGGAVDTTGGTTTTSGTTTGGATTTGDATTTGGIEDTDTDTDTGGEWDAEGCPAIFAQDLLPTFEIDLSASELAELEAEWLVADDNNTPEHPVELFRYEDITITDASVRLRGNATWWPEQGKMQLEVSFNTYDKGGRFMGLKHLVFDAAKENRSFLRDRLALQILRDVGVPSPCANNARIELNGEYYGLFTSLEKVDSEFLERVFADPDGNLYKRSGWDKKTNEDDPDESDIDALLDADDLEELDEVMNLDEAVLEWAAEAVIPDGDGAWAAGLNFYVYNDPLSGFNVIPWDMDATFTRLPYTTDPYVYIKPNDHGRPFYEIVMADPEWFQKYIDAIEFVLTTGYDVDLLQQRMDTWGAQIKTAVEDDPNRPFTMSEHLNSLDAQYDYVDDRAEFVEQWLECWQDGGVDLNNDGLCDP